MKTRVKICGITRLEDAEAAIRAGADALGFVFYPPSPRAISPENAQAIIARLPPLVTTVGLFVNSEPELVDSICKMTQIDLIQFHGDETADQCDRLGRPYIKAIRMRPQLNLEAEIAAYPKARAVLLDAYKPGVPGGTGEAFDWNRIPKAVAQRVILAGGLRPENVGSAIDQVMPYAVDVSGGVEASYGIKDPQKIEQFMVEVYRVSKSE